MPKGLQSKNIAFTERVPPSLWNYNCNGEIIKTCRNKKSFDLWVKLHKKNCLDCQNRSLALTDTKIETPTGQIII